MAACTVKESLPAETLVFQAELADITKASFNAGKMSWTAGDVIRIGNGTSWVDITLAAADIAPDGRTASLTVTGLAAADNYYAVYPASNCGSGLTVTGGNVEITVPSVQNSCFTCVASCGASDLRLGFKHPFALVNVTTTYSTIDHVSICSINGESLAGTVSVNIATGSCSWVSAGAATVTAPMAELCGFVEIVPLETFSGGLRLDAYDADDLYMGSVSRTGRKNVAANTYYTLATGTSFPSAPVASVGGSNFYTFAEAAQAFNAGGGTLTYNQDNSTEVTFSATSGTVDMNGYSQKAKIWINNASGTLTIMNGVLTPTGDCIDGEYGFNHGFGGTVILENMTVKGILWTDSHNFIINSGEYNQIRNMKRNEIDNSGTVTITGGKFNQFYHYGSGGWSEGTYYISGGKFKFDPTTLGSNFNVVIADGYSVQDNPDSDSSTYGKIVAPTP